MESLEELRRICQKPRYKEEGNWMARHITRDMALPLTRALLHFPVTANHVTTFSIAAVLAAAIFLAQGTPASVLWGALLFQFWYLLDHVDGQVARYRGQASTTGIFYDFISHHIVNLSMLSSLGYGLFRESGETALLAGGFVAACSITLFHMIYESQYKALFAAFTKMAKESPEGFAKVIVRRPSDAKSDAPRTASLSKKLYSLLHKLCEVHVLMNLLTLFAVLCAFTGDLAWLRLFVLYYALAAPLVLIVKLRHMLKTKSVDAAAEGYLK